MHYYCARPKHSKHFSFTTRSISMPQFSHHHCFYFASVPCFVLASSLKSFFSQGRGFPICQPHSPPLHFTLCIPHNLRLRQQARLQSRWVTVMASPWSSQIKVSLLSTSPCPALTRLSLIGPMDAFLCSCSASIVAPSWTILLTISTTNSEPQSLPTATSGRKRRIRKSPNRRTERYGLDIRPQIHTKG